VKLNDEVKQVRVFNDTPKIGYGVHEVKLMLVEAGTTNAGKEYVQFNLADDGGAEGSARVWFTTDKAANFRFNVMRQVFVHCAPEAKKDDARNQMDKVEDSDQAVKLLNEKCIGKQIWFTKYINPGNTYTDQSGATKQSVNTSVYGYKPKLREDLMPKAQFKGEDVTGKVNIPAEWS
jgi:hypothetical protein